MRDDPRPPFLDVPLDVSFRSTGAVLKLVDAVIAGPGRDGVLDPGQSLTHGLKRGGQAGLVEVWPRCRPVKLDDPEPWAVPQVTTGMASPLERLAQAIAAKIAALVGQEELPSRGRKIRAGDIMVLVRSRDPFVLNLVRWLKKEGIAVSGIDRLRLLEDIAVMDLMAFADFLLMPEDDLNLAALLKSPLIGLKRRRRDAALRRSRFCFGLVAAERDGATDLVLPRGRGSPQPLSGACRFRFTLRAVRGPARRRWRAEALAHKARPRGR